MTKEEQDRTTRLEIQQEHIYKKLDKIETTLEKLNSNLVSFTQTLALIGKDSHNKADCKNELEDKFLTRKESKALILGGAFVASVITGVVSYFGFKQ